jgi:hypothetical protein
MVAPVSVYQLVTGLSAKPPAPRAVAQRLRALARTHRTRPALPWLEVEG